MNPVFQQVCDHFLTTRSWFWWGDEQKESVSKPYIHSCTAMRIAPGGKAQPLHRDDYINHNYHEEIDAWDDERDKNRESAIGFFVAGSRITKENGGTQFIPRSHLWYVFESPSLVILRLTTPLSINSIFLHPGAPIARHLRASTSASSQICTRATHSSC